CFSLEKVEDVLGSEPSYDAFASNVHRKASGVRSVVTITSRMTAENSPSSTTPMLFPIPAKIKPTSPRGIMPNPTAHRFIRFGHPKPLKTFPMIATDARDRKRVVA